VKLPLLEGLKTSENEMLAVPAEDKLCVTGRVMVIDFTSDTVGDFVTMFVIVCVSEAEPVSLMTSVIVCVSEPVPDFVTM